MESVDELTQDCMELQNLLKSATRSHVRQLLASEITTLQHQIHTIQEGQKKQEDASDGRAEAKENKQKEEAPPIFTKRIQSYGWDQSDKMIKIYVQLQGIDNLPKENIKLDVKSRSFNLLVCNLENRNHNLPMNNLLEEIDSQGSSFKVKSGNIIITLKKKEAKTWPHLTSSEKKAVDAKTPNIDKDDDPSAGIMKMMKQMYDDGDDEMKRTIAKAWTESRDKQATGKMDF
eukprot:gene16023-17642_t